MKIRKIVKTGEHTGKDVDGKYIHINVYAAKIWDGNNLSSERTIYTTADHREITRRKKDGAMWVALEIAPFDSALLSENFVPEPGDKPFDPSKGAI